MDSRFLAVSALGVVGGCVVMTAMASLGVIHMTGPRMCDQLCRNRIGCSSYLFMTSDLSCQVTNVSVTQHNPDKGVYFFSNKQKKVVGKNTTCQQNSKVHHTQRNGLKCEYLRAEQRLEKRKWEKQERTPGKKVVMTFPKEVADVLEMLKMNFSEAMNTSLL